MPCFEGLRNQWQIHQQDHPETSAIVEQGLTKLAGYWGRLDETPAYTLAVRKYCLCSVPNSYLLISLYLQFSILTGVSTGLRNIYRRESKK